MDVDPSFRARVRGVAALPRYIDGSPKTLLRGVLHAAISVLAVVSMLVGVGGPLRVATVTTSFHVMKLSSHVVSATLHLAPFRTIRQMRFVARLDAVLIHLSIIGSSAISVAKTRAASLIPGTLHGGIVALASCNALAYAVFPALYSRCLVVRIALCVLHSALAIVEIGAICGATPLLMVTGACYLLGTLCYVAASCVQMERARRWQRYWGFHEDFHLLIFVGDVLSMRALDCCAPRPYLPGQLHAAQ